MNRKILFLGVLLLISLSRCNDSDKSTELLEVTQSLSFNEKGSTGYVDISSNTKWTLTCSDGTWLACTPMSGEGDARVQVTAKANSQASVRTGEIGVKTPGGIAKSVQVTQGGLEPFIIIDPTTVSALPVGEDITLQITASGEWTAQIPDDAKNWIKFKFIATTQVIFAVSPNLTGADRSANIVFKVDGTNKQESFVLSQGAADNINLKISPEQASVTDVAGDVTVSVTADFTWNVLIPATDTWVKEKQRTNDLIVFSLEENLTGKERTSNIAFQTKKGTTLATFALTQAKGYELMTSMNPQAAQAGLLYDQLHNFMSIYGFDYTEHPHCTGGYGGHSDGVHLVVERDAGIDNYVFRFDIHIDPVIDGDRCNETTVDRQRNEMKSATNNTTWAKVQGNWDEWQRLEWKFKLPVGFQPTSSFCHIHQIKAQDGPNNGNPVITITPRANSNGANKRMQVIHVVDGANTGLGTVVDNIPLSDFEGEWVQVAEEIHYTHNGYYSIKITRIRDNKELISYTKENIDMWRKGASFLRNKFGIYRSLAGGKLNETPVNQSPLLKNESVWMCDFKIYEKNTNPNPGQPHE